MVEASLDRQRQAEPFDIFYQAAEAKSNNITYKACLPRYRRVPRKLSFLVQKMCNLKTPKYYYRQQYYETINTVKGQIKKRFFH